MYTIGETLYGGSEYGFGSPFQFHQTLRTPMYYNDGFLPAGGAQTDSLFSSLAGVVSNLGSQVITQAFQPRPSFGQLPATTVPSPTMPPVMSNQHPVLGTAGNQVSPVYGPSPSQGGHGRYYPPGTKGTHQVKKGPHAGSWVKNRHRDVCNPRALRRALSRAHGFERFARKVMHFVHPGRRGRLVFKRRTRRK